MNNEYKVLSPNPIATPPTKSRQSPLYLLGTSLPKSPIPRSRTARRALPVGWQKSCLT